MTGTLKDKGSEQSACIVSSLCDTVGVQHLWSIIVRFVAWSWGMQSADNSPEQLVKFWLQQHE